MAKKLKLRIPKRVAGVKMPRNVRKGPVAKFLNSSAGQLILAEALLLVGGAVAAEARGSRSALQLVRDPDSGAGRGGGERAETGAQSSILSAAFGDAIRAFRTSVEQHLSGDRETTQAEAKAETVDVQGDAARAKKKGAGSPIETPSMPH